MFARYSAILTLLAISATAVQANDFRPGYVVTVSGDTLRGEIHHANVVDLTQQVHFRDSEGEVSTFAPDDIAAFALEDGRRFLSRNVHLRNEAQPRSVFLMLLEQGAMNLLVLIEDHEIFFIEADHFPIAQLPPADEEFDSFDREVQRRRPYVSTFVRALYPCPDVQQRADQVRFSARSFGRIVRAYNECMGEPSLSTRMSRPVGFDINVTVRGGVGVARLYYELLGTSEPRVIPYVGVAAEVGIPRIFGGLNVLLEASYMQKGRAEEGYFFKHADPAPEDFESHYFAMQFGFRYQMPLQSVRPYASIGVFMSHIPGEPREVITPLGYRPPRNDGGIFAELGIALPQIVQFGELIVGLRLEQANSGTISPVDFRGGYFWPIKNQSAVVVSGVRF